VTKKFGGDRMNGLTTIVGAVGGIFPSILTKSSLECEKTKDNGSPGPPQISRTPSTEMHSVKVFGWVTMADGHYGFAFRKQAAFFPLIASFLTDYSNICHIFGGLG
jgi:hypothetical protein